MAYTQQAGPLVGTGAIGGARQGASIALSADGNTLAVGGYNDNGGIGAIWIYTRSGSSWTPQAGPIIGTGAVPTSGAVYQGYTNSVALSADGNTLAFGGYQDNSSIGAVWIWTRSGGTWTQQGTKLSSTNYTLGTFNQVGQGSSVALSNDGNTLAVGGFWNNTNVGAAWIWTRTGGVWTEQASQLAGTGSSGQSFQGGAIALSSDGNTLAVGGANDDNSNGAVWIWTRSGGTWTQQGTKLYGTGTVTFSQQGASVALSSDSNTLAVGGPQDNSGVGATWIWTRSGGTWTQQGPKLVSNDSASNQLQGVGVALKDDGNLVAIGGSGFVDGSTVTGATWIWTRSGGTWTQQGSPLIGSGVTGILGAQGSSLALSDDGNTVAIGGPYDGFDGSQFFGAAWVFTYSADPTTTTTTSTSTTTAAPTSTTTSTSTTSTSTSTTSTSTSTTSTTTLGPSKKQFTLTNTGTGLVTLQSMNFNDPVGIGHTANLSNLGGSSTETGNAILFYPFSPNSVKTFTVDYNNAGAGAGTFSGNIVIGGSNGTTAIIDSTIIIIGPPTSTTTSTSTSTTTLPPTSTTTLPPTSTTTSTSTSTTTTAPTSTTTSTSTTSTSTTTTIAPTTTSTTTSTSTSTTTAAPTTTTTTTAAPLGPVKAMFGFGVSGGTYSGSYMTSGTYYNTITFVSSTGAYVSESSGSGTIRAQLAAGRYGGDKVIFGFGRLDGYPALNTISKFDNLGNYVSESSGSGRARGGISAATYGGDKVIFGYGTTINDYTNAITKFDNLGNYVSEDTGASRIRSQAAAATYGGDKAIFGFGEQGPPLRTIVLFNNLGNVTSEILSQAGATARYALAAAGYGNDKVIFGYGSTFSGVSNTISLFSNTGAFVSESTSVGTARQGLAAATYGGDKAMFGFGFTTSYVNITSSFSNLGAYVGESSGVGTARAGLGASNYGS